MHIWNAAKGQIFSQDIFDYRKKQFSIDNWYIGLQGEQFIRQCSENNSKLFSFAKISQKFGKLTLYDGGFLWSVSYLGYI